MDFCKRRVLIVNQNEREIALALDIKGGALAGARLFGTDETHDFDDLGGITAYTLVLPANAIRVIEL